MNLFGPHQKVAMAICTPIPSRRLANGQVILDTITVEWHRKKTGLDLPTNINTIEMFADGMEVGDARTKVAYRCLAHEPRPEYLFFLDYDVLPDYDALTKLFFRLQCNPQIDIAAGVYCLKGHNPPDPLIYSGEGMGPFWDWAVGDILTTEQHGISSVHMGLTLIRTSLFQRMLDAGVVTEETPFFETTSKKGRENGCLMTRRGSEDIWFCSLAQQVGCQILVDTSVLAGHIDKHTGVTWGLYENTPPVQRAKWMTGADKKEAEEDGLKLALDLGAGETRRIWSAHKTYTTDLRREAKPDYIQDTRKLNLPDNHFDLVASSHHLEHIGRWDQETAWAEIFRVTKPGGKIEHIVPSLEWAAHKIANNQIDEHTYNVLYGAQEAHGYARELNLHYFGYTKAIARELAEEAGFEDVKTTDYRDDESLGYNLVICGNKPGVAELAEA